MTPTITHIAVADMISPTVRRRRVIFRVSNRNGGDRQPIPVKSGGERRRKKSRQKKKKKKKKKKSRA